MAVMTRWVSWGYSGDGDGDGGGGNGDLKVASGGSVIRSGCACGEKAGVEEAGEEAGCNGAEVSSCGAARNALSTISTMSVSVKRSRTCTL